MNKRGQLFLLAAIIICVLVYQVTAKYNTAKEYGGVEGFEELSENYDGELIKVINWNTLEGIPKEDMPDKIADYTRKYTKFARTKDQNYGIAYLYKSKDEDGNDIYIIRNFLSEDKRIIIKFTDLEGEKKIKLFNEEERTEGIINLAFMGSMGKIGVSAPISAYGDEFTQGRVPGGVKNIDLFIGESNIPLSFRNLESREYITYQTSNADPGTVEVKVTEA